VVRYEVCKVSGEWGTCGSVGFGVSRCGAYKVGEEWRKRWRCRVGGLEGVGGIVECVQGK
jgi:hypothetical protein